MLRQQDNDFLLALVRNRDAFNVLAAHHLTLGDLHALALASYDTDQIVLAYLISDPVRLIRDFHYMSVHLLTRFIEAHGRLVDGVFNVVAQRGNRYALACALLMCNSEKLLTLSAELFDQFCKHLPEMKFPSHVYRSLLFNGTFYSKAAQTVKLVSDFVAHVDSMSNASKNLIFTSHDFSNKLNLQAMSHSFNLCAAKPIEEGDQPSFPMVMNFRGMNFFGYGEIASVDLSGACLADADLRNVNFHIQYQYHFSAAKAVMFTGASFRRAKLDNMEYAWSKFPSHDVKCYLLNLEQCDFSYASLKNVKMKNSIMNNCTLYGTDLSHSQFMHASFNNVDFKTAILSNTSFSSCTFLNADFSNVNLLTTEFLGSCNGGNFNRTKTSNKTFADCYLSNVTLRECHLDELKIENKSMGKVDFHAASLRNANFFKTAFKEIVFSHACMRDVNFLHAKLEDCDFSNANLCGANFSYAQLIRVNFTRTVLTDVKFQNAKAELEFFDVKLTEASIAELLNFYDVTLVGNDTFPQLKKFMVDDLLKKIKEADIDIDLAIKILEIAAPHPVFANHKKSKELKSGINKLTMFLNLDGAALIKTESQAAIITELDRLRDLVKANKHDKSGRRS